MAFQYNDNRPISNHTHIDYPLTCGTNNSGTVTWVDFINFRNVDNFGIEPNKQPIGGTWLNVLDKLQGCFDEINTRLNSLEEGPSSISIGGNPSFGDNSSTFLVSNINANWSIQDISTSDKSGRATIPYMALANIADTYTNVSVNTAKPSFDHLLGDIKFYQHDDGHYHSYDNVNGIDESFSEPGGTYIAPTSTVTLGENGINIMCKFESGDDVRWTAIVKATSKTNSQLSTTKYVYKDFKNPNSTAGKWNWTCSGPFDIVHNNIQDDINYQGDDVSITYTGNDTYANGMLICTNSNGGLIPVKLVFGASQLRVTFNPNNGSNPWTEIVDAGTTITLPDGQTREEESSYAEWKFDGWCTNIVDPGRIDDTDMKFSGDLYGAQTSFTVTHDITFYAYYYRSFK